ncbi:MAG: hypothetical protein M1814_003091 [Vezdaea aestivalis]|nr:MAG: hypothetical protein M1814_003091 [Vezdaea aestivalis]
MESAATRLQKEAKGYLDSLRAMTASQMRIAETIDAFYGDAGTKDGVSRSYKQAVEDLDAETIKALDGPYRTTVLEPISRFCAYFPDINECIKKRNHKLLDYDSMRAKVKKLVEKPDKDVTKLPRAEKEQEMAKVAYEQLNDQLFTELPQLIDLRVPYLDPSFEALVKIQLRFCAEAYSRMAQVQQYLDADTREQYAEGHLDQRVEQVLQEIRDLSIAEARQPAFLRRIKEQYNSGESQRSDQPQARPKRPHHDDEEDEPTYVDGENNQTLSRAEYEQMKEYTEGRSSDAATADSSKAAGVTSTKQEDGANGSNLGLSKSQPQEATIGAKRKQKTVKTFKHDEDEDEAEGSKPEAKTTSTEVQKPKPKKAKKVKLSFADEDP